MLTISKPTPVSVNKCSLVSPLLLRSYFSVSLSHPLSLSDSDVRERERQLKRECKLLWCMYSEEEEEEEKEEKEVEEEAEAAQRKAPQNWVTISVSEYISSHLVLPLLLYDSTPTTQRLLPFLLLLLGLLLTTPTTAYYTMSTLIV